jgi:predicted RNase H-like HicB family nuclease
MDSVLEELRSGARESLEHQMLELKRLSVQTWEKKESNEAQIRQALFTFLSQLRIVYEITVAQARKTKSSREVNALWNQTRDFYAGKFLFWEDLKAQWRNGPENDAFIFIGQALKRLEQASAQPYSSYAVKYQGEQSKLRLTAVFEACEEGGFHAFIPEIKGVHTQGETLEEATDNLADALAQTFAYKVERGLDNQTATPSEPQEVKVNLAA